MLELQPGIDQIRLDETPILDRVLEYAPGESAPALALSPGVLLWAEEGGSPAEVDSVAEADHHRSLIVLELAFERRRDKIGSGAEIPFPDGIEPPRPCQGDGDEGADGREILRHVNAQCVRDFAPDDAADGHRAEDDGQKDRQAAPANP